MAGFSQPQDFFAAARLFWIFGSMRASIGSTQIFIGSRIFLFEVWRHSDFQQQTKFRTFWGAYRPPKPRKRPKIDKTCLLYAMIIQSKITLGFFWLDTIEEPMARGFQNTLF